MVHSAARAVPVRKPSSPSKSSAHLFQVDADSDKFFMSGRRLVLTVFKTYGFTLKACLVLLGCEETAFDETATLDLGQLSKELDVTDKALRESLDDIEADKVMAPRKPIRDRHHHGRVRIGRPNVAVLAQIERRRKSRAGIGGRPPKMPAEVATEAHVTKPPTEKPAASQPKPVEIPAKVECPACHTTFKTSLVKINGLWTSNGTQVPFDPGESPPRIKEDRPTAGRGNSASNSAEGLLERKELSKSNGTQVPLAVATPAKFDPTPSYGAFWTRYKEWNDALPGDAREWWWTNVKSDEYAASILEGLGRFEVSQAWEDRRAIPAAFNFLRKHRYMEHPRPAAPRKLSVEEQAREILRSRETR